MARALKVFELRHDWSKMFMPGFKKLTRAERKTLKKSDVVFIRVKAKSQGQVRNRFYVWYSCKYFKVDPVEQNSFCNNYDNARDLLSL